MAAPISCMSTGSEEATSPNNSGCYWRGDVLVMLRADGDREFHYTNSPRLDRLYELPQAAQLLEKVRLTLAVAGDQVLPLLVARAGPLVCEPTPGALSCGVQLDLSDRAVELLSALAADQDPELRPRGDMEPVLDGITADAIRPTASSTGCAAFGQPQTNGRATQQKSAPVRHPGSSHPYGSQRRRWLVWLLAGIGWFLAAALAGRLL